MRAWLAVHWRNGLKFQIAISILILGGVTALYLQFYAFTQRGDAPGVTVQSVSVESPVTDTVRYTRVYCNDSDHLITGSVQRRLIGQGEEDAEVTIPETSSVELAPGCHEATRTFALPEAVTPGTWALRLLVTTASPELRLVSDTSAPFVVGE
jgi:hypothetical protein